MINIVVLISGNGSNLQAIINAGKSGKLPVNILAVISNNAGAYGLERAAAEAINTEVLDHRNYSDREQYDQALQNLIDSFNPDLVVLAGFMRVLGASLVNHYLGKMINIHPSLLPLFPGLDTHQKALDSGCTEHGASVHFVTPEVDSGPIIAQASVPINKDDTVETLKQRVHEQEHIIYPQVIQWFAEKRINLKNNTAYFDGHEIDQPSPE